MALSVRVTVEITLFQKVVRFVSLFVQIMFQPMERSVILFVQTKNNTSRFHLKHVSQYAIIQRFQNLETNVLYPVIITFLLTGSIVLLLVLIHIFLNLGNNVLLNVIIL